MTPEEHTAAAKVVADRLAQALGTVAEPKTVTLSDTQIAALQLTASIGVLHATLGITR